MSLWEFRQAVESMIPAWVTFVVPIVTVLIYLIAERFWRVK